MRVLETDVITVYQVPLGADDHKRALRFVEWFEATIDDVLVEMREVDEEVVWLTINAASPGEAATVAHEILSQYEESETIYEKVDRLEIMVRTRTNMVASNYKGGSVQIAAAKEPMSLSPYHQKWWPRSVGDSPPAGSLCAHCGAPAVVMVTPETFACQACHDKLTTLFGPAKGPGEDGR